MYYQKNLPFDDENDNEDNIARLTLLRNPEFPSRYWNSRTKESMELVKQCLMKNKDNRPNINQFNENSWLNLAEK